MTRRALLIGAATYRLTGPDHDVAVLAAALEKRGFTDVRACRGPAATRAGILEEYERLIDDTDVGDMVLVYYSGHGGYVWPMADEDDGVARNNRQFIVPTDFGEPAGDDFRGITAVELSVLLGWLTERTNNAAVVLDCCHSALMTRDIGEFRVRQLPKVTFLDLQAHLRRALDAGLRVDLSRPLGNPNAVRLVACATEQLAVELPRRDGTGNYGLLTDAFVRALDEAAGSRVSWARLVARVRQLVQTVNPHQRPEAEGPADRILFEVTTDDAVGWLPVIVDDDGQFRFPGAPLLGVQPGDEFAVMPSSATGPSDEGRIATVRISRCDPTTAIGPPRFSRPGAVLPLGARAFRTTAAAPRTPVRGPAWLESGIRESMYARVADLDEDVPVEVRQAADGSIVVRDRIGPLHQPKASSAEAERQTVENVNRIARATALRRIREESGWAAAAHIDVEWGCVRDGEPQPLPLSGATVGVGDMIYIKIDNRGSRDVHVSLIDIGVSYAINVVTGFAPAGVRVPAGRGYTLGLDHGDNLVGEPLTWPAGLDPGGLRPETVVVLVTGDPHDVSVLQQHGVRGDTGKSWRDRPPTYLDEMLAHFGAGADRKIGYTSREIGQRMTFSAQFIEFTLDPVGRRAGVGAGGAGSAG
jgi:hypothetical protein